MDKSILLVITGGLISLISTIIVIFFQYLTEKKKIINQIKSNPSSIVYNKQIEFYELLNPILDEINGFITALDVWLGEIQSEQVLKNIENARHNTIGLDKLNQLIDQYFIFLPSEVLQKLSELLENCFYLSNSPNLEITYKSMNQLFGIRNKLRQYVGTEALSYDLLKSFSTIQKDKKIQKKN